MRKVRDGERCSIGYEEAAAIMDATYETWLYMGGDVRWFVFAVPVVP
jgi:hypothetical protein